MSTIFSSKVIFSLFYPSIYTLCTHTKVYSDHQYQPFFVFQWTTTSTSSRRRLLLILFYFHIIHHHLTHPPLLPSPCRRHPCRKKAAKKEKDIMMTMIIIITFIHTYKCCVSYIYREKREKDPFYLFLVLLSSNSTRTKTPRVLVFFLFFFSLFPFYSFSKKDWAAKKMKLGSERDGKVVCVIIIISCDPTRLNSLFSLHGVHAHILFLWSSFSSYFYQRERFTFSFLCFFLLFFVFNVGINMYIIWCGNWIAIVQSEKKEGSW